MVKHTPTIRWLLPSNCLGVFEHFVELELKRVKYWANKNCWGIMLTVNYYCCKSLIGMSSSLNFPQPVFTCSKLTKETLELGVKYVQS